MTTGRELIYWDCCVLLSWIKGEVRPDDVQARLQEVAQAVAEGRTRLITSVLTHVEILQSKLSAEARGKYEEAFQRRGVHALSVDIKIAALASKIRDYYNDKKKLKTPDAIHVATAILYGADELQTFDHSDLLRLDGNVAGEYPLKIVVPRREVGPLFPKSDG